MSALLPFKLFVAVNVQRAFAPGYPKDKIRQDGYHDIQLPLSQMLRMANAYPDAVVRIVDAGHELPVEEPAELTVLIGKFVTAPTA